MTNRPVHPWVAERAEGTRFAISTAAGPDPGATREQVQQFEELGFDAVFLPDHPMMMADPWLTLAALAPVTSRIRLGPLVSCAAYRHPAMLARAAADLDRLSGGRAVLGVGSGDMPHEFGMLGLDHGTAVSRRRRLETTLQVLPPLLRGEPVTCEGDGFALRDAVLPMPPVQQPHVPILVAGGSRPALRMVAGYADAANLGAVGWAGGAYTAEDIEARCTTLAESCLAVGRAPDSVLRTALVGVSVGDTREQAQGALAGMPPPLRAFFGDLFCAGTADDIADRLNTMIGAGIDYVVLIVADHLLGHGHMTERLVSDVLPQLRSVQPAGAR
jgi:alkanesulfonate monooxygenase SsuD/methylene tetrahydromethanopterin reductase-like flavin-dependent oxidoreductase (luciferase family)